MIHNYDNVSDLIIDLESINPRKNQIFTEYGKLEKVEISCIPKTDDNYIFLSYRPFSKYYGNVLKSYSYTLNEFKTLAFRYLLEEFYLYTQVHETGDETDFDTMVLQAESDPGGASDLALTKLTEEAISLRRLQWYPKWVRTNPEMEIFEEDYSEIENDATISLGTISSGGNTSKLFRIRNIGEDKLVLDGSPVAQVLGTDAAEFTLTVLPVTPVYTNTETTFTISWTAGPVGVKSARIEIPSNTFLPEEDPFVINITAEST